MNSKERMWLPLIAPDDFDTFRELMGDEIAPTREKWRQGHADRIARYARENIIIEESVSADEFARYCSSECRAPNGMNLIIFAELKWKAKQ